VDCAAETETKGNADRGYCLSDFTNKQKGRRSALCLNRQARLAERGVSNAATNLGQLREAQLDNFFFIFNDLLNDLVHGRPLIPFKSDSIELNLKRLAFRPICESGSM